MIKLVVCVGFLAVFGLVGYCIILLMTKAFDNDQKQKESKVKEDTINQKPKTEEDGN